ncbi:acyl carrier protein [Streptomyces sp. NPDC004788]
MTEATDAATRAEINRVVKEILIAEARLSVGPDALADDEPLGGELLKVNSLGFLGMLIRLEDELDVTLPDDLFVGHTFHTVADLVAVIERATEMNQ